ncbi:MAG TPA: universal stress protein [Nitrosopumilaceae archaeon]|nr:universal stress protein [Nitrosopumilaceae archaeon]
MSFKHNNKSRDVDLKNQLSVIKNSVAVILDRARYGSYEKFLEHISRIDNAVSKMIGELEGEQFSPAVTKYKRILVPYDGSKYSKKALNEAIEISKKFFSTIYIVNVVDIALDTPTNISQGIVNKKLKKLTRVFLESENKNANTMLQNKMKSCVNMGIEVRCEAMVGNPVDSLLRFSKNHKIDLIVIGSRDLTKVRKIMALGSVSRKISEESECPVLMVH